MAQLDSEGALAIVAEMYRFVGKNFNREDVEHDPEWFLKTTWTQQQQSSFQSWIEKLLCTKYKQSAVVAAKGAAWFIFNYGFKVEETNG